MQLNEIIEENTLQNISRKTRLSVENLEKLFSREFGEFRKVQALGFISILEREYQADLSTLRTECLEHFAGEGHPQEATFVPENPVHAAQQKSPIIDTANRVIFPAYVKPMVIGLLVALLLYGAWTTLATDTSSENSGATQTQGGGFFASMMHQARSWMGDTPAPDQETTFPQEQPASTSAPKPDAMPEQGAADDTPPAAETTAQHASSSASLQPQEEQPEPSADPKSLSVEEMQVDHAIASANETAPLTPEPLAAEVPSVVGASQPTETNTAPQEASPQTETVDASTQEGNLEAEAARTLAQEQQKATEEMARKRADEEAARIQAAQEKAAQEKAAQEAAARAAAENAAQEKADQERVAREKIAQAKAAKEKAAQEKAAKAKAAKAKAQKAKAAKAKAAKEKAAKEKAAKEKAAKLAAAKETVVLKPRARIWLGIVDLTTMHRSTSTSASAKTFSKPKGRWTVVTGHGRLGFKTPTGTVNFNDSKKHYLIIQKGTVHEISHESFQKLNKSKVW